MNGTLDYYNQNAKEYVRGTLSVDFKRTQDAFLEYLDKGTAILDFGCGSGRDTKYFLENGYRVESTDGSSELCRLASDFTGVKVRKMLFADLDEIDKYDGIWACSSILHCPRTELKDVLIKMIQALKDEGVIYTSFKYGDFEGVRNGRYFTDFTLESFEEYICDVHNLFIEEHWISGDVRPERGDERWLNLILRKKGADRG